MTFIRKNQFVRFVALLAIVMTPILAQTFSSGSTGADGALSLTTPGTYVFDPKTFTPPLNPSGDGIFNFTTITIGSGVTVKVTGAVFNTPVVWLASGAVKIDGTVDLSGQNAFSANNTTLRTYSTPGAGGYPGGYPSVGGNPAGPGLGPLGGPVGLDCNSWSTGGGVSANQFAVPLVGGSGGGALGSNSGGAGGGAILIASSASVTGSGTIRARGGEWTSGTGAGGGGTIRIVAPTVTLSGPLNAGGGGQGCQSGASRGIVRIEAFTVGSINIEAGNLYTATPYGLYLSNAGLPSVKVATIGGNPVAASPTGTFTVPDVTVNSNGPLAVAVQATNIPIGTIATITFFSENGPDQVVQTTPLAGTLAASTATASVTLPSGFSKGFIKATFTQ